MAIDTAAKRSSCLDHEEPWQWGTPLPDGAIGQGDRQHAIWSYSGILVSAPAVVTLAVVRIFTAKAKLRGHVFDTLKVFTPKAKVRGVVVQEAREPMSDIDPIAPGETETLTWTFRLASGETIVSGSTVLSAVQNCSLSGSHSVSGAIVSQKVAVSSGATLGDEGQVRCRVVTSAGRQLDKTYAFEIAHHFNDAGWTDPDDTDDVTADLANVLGSETISSFDASLYEGDLTLGSESNTTTTATVRKTGGTDGTRQSIAFVVGTSGGRTLKEIGWMRTGEL